MKNQATLSPAFLVILLIGCGSGPDPVAPAEPVEAVAEEDEVVAAPPNYQEREGDLYMYVTAVSEEDQKKGVSTGKVVIFRYLGVRDGRHRLENVRDNGTAIDVSECADPCKVIKSVSPDGSVERTGFNASSVIGSAFEDAFAGRLEVAKGVGKASLREREESEPDGERLTAIPASFTGEWNADRKDCGSQLNDSLLRVGARRLTFYESGGTVTRVTDHGGGALAVEARFEGEGETWTRTVELKLAPSGSYLLVDGSMLSRCPA